jgi:hypothetical protein
MDVIEKSGIYFGGVHPDHVVHFLSYRTLCLASTGQEAEIRNSQSYRDKLKMRRAMHRPDRLGALVVVFAVFVLYLGIADLLSYIGIVSLPLVVGNSGTLVFAVLELAILGLYINRQRKRGQKL